MKLKKQLNNETNRWDILVRREAAVEDVFYYAVKTTGVFCRCGCASRLPNQENVEFFDTCKDAELAGYRPCKRCQPGNLPSHEAKETIIVEACRRIEQTETPLKLQSLAAESGISAGHFHRLFKKIVKVTPKQYAAIVQSQRFRKSLKNGQSVTEAIYDAGYSSSSRAYEKSQERLAMTPRVYKNGGTGLSIQYSISECSLGLIVVAATDLGICAIEFGDDQETMVEQLQASFPKATLRAAGKDFSSVVRDVIVFIDTPTKDLKLPLDIQGTAFQKRVWTALREIQPGTTSSYGEIAERIGRPQSARAVANACASNTLAVAIPCHRVVRGDGKISGYKWGVQRKRLLLDRETGKAKRSETQSKVTKKT
jgi:AraC family transcriptional regulator of adaptative response/methylated-DNA-[protein]-cysteine methyltransferase